jgi:DNA adenine methylase
MKPTNPSTVTHRSPFRYPGGKTWLVPYVRTWLERHPRPTVFLEPFAGGASVGLSVLFDGLADQVVLVEKDEAVASVWAAVVTGWAPELAELVLSFEMTESNVRELLANPRGGVVHLAFQTIVRNRVQRGGIMAPGAGLMKSGENGNGLKSRWYAATLARRLRDLHDHRERLAAAWSDGIDEMRAWRDRVDVAYFIDPPYTVAGGRLYTHHRVDHAALFEAAAELRGPWMMTYDDTREIRDLASRHGMAVAEVPMKTTHHEVKKELVITSE